MTYPFVAEGDLLDPHPRPGFLTQLTLAALRLARLRYDRHRQRLDLSLLDDHALRDIGLSPEEVRRECAKPFWL